MFKKYVGIEPKYKLSVRYIYDTDTNIEYREVICNQDFLDIGAVPTPRNKREQFIHDLCHGFLMRYSFASVIEYSLRNFFNNWKGWTNKK